MMGGGIDRAVTARRSAKTLCTRWYQDYRRGDAERADILQGRDRADAAAGCGQPAGTILLPPWIEAVPLGAAAGNAIALRGCDDAAISSRT